MRQDLFDTGTAKDRPTPVDLSAEIIQSISRGSNERVTCTRVSANNYRCNWWSPAPTKAFDNPAMYGLLVTTHIVTKSRFLNVTKVDRQLVINDISVGAVRG